jgi:hypothetical protein
MEANGWRTGPVAIIGANGQVGTALQRRLTGFPNEVWPNTYVAANLDTVVAALAALLDSAVERVVFLSYIDADPGTFELAGPEAVTIDEFVRHVGGEGIRIRHIRPWAARLLARLLPSLPWPLVDVMLRDCLPKGDPQETARRFGFTLHRLSEVWPR